MRIMVSRICGAFPGESVLGDTVFNRPPTHCNWASRIAGSRFRIFFFHHRPFPNVFLLVVALHLLVQGNLHAPYRVPRHKSRHRTLPQHLRSSVAYSPPQSLYIRYSAFNISPYSQRSTDPSFLSGPSLIVNTHLSSFVHIAGLTKGEGSVRSSVRPLQLVSIAHSLEVSTQ